MYQEYHDWEKAFKSQAANEKADINTGNVWNHVKNHIPAVQRKRNWMPFWLLLSGASMLVAASLWRENDQLRVHNNSLNNQLAGYKNRLLSCEKRQIDMETHHALAASNVKTIENTLSVNPTKEKINTRSVPQASATNAFATSLPKDAPTMQENSPVYRDEVNLPSLPITKTICLLTDNIKIPGISYGMKVFGKPNLKRNFVAIAPCFGVSSLRGSMISKDLNWSNKNLYQWGAQFSFGKYLSRNWFTALQLNYQIAQNQSSFTSLKSERTEVEGTTQVLIDANGNVKTIAGPTGATTYHQINATLYNTAHQVLLSPVLGYTLFKRQQPFLSVFTSAQWLLFNQSSGKAPLGNQPLGKSLVEQWTYRQKLPSLGLGFTAYQPLYHNWQLGYGAQALYHTDQFSSAEMILNRQGVSMNLYLGLQNNF